MGDVQSLRAALGVGAGGESHKASSVTANRKPESKTDSSTPAGLQPQTLSAADAKKILGSQEIRQAAADLSQRMAAHGSNSEVLFDSESGRFVVRITDAVYGNLILQIPSQDSLDLHKRLEEITGMILNRTS